MIMDSGERREFDTGAVRDIQKGKGRCDLMPLDVAADLMANTPFTVKDAVLMHIDEFTFSGDIYCLETALSVLAKKHFKNIPDMLLEVAVHFEEGAAKYSPNNWKKGLTAQCYIDSAVRHYLKLLRGDDDERHDRACAWNLMCCAWTCKHKPELNSYAKKEDVECERPRRPMYGTYSRADKKEEENK